MTAAKVKRSCPECELAGSWHYTDDLEPKAFRCPNYLAADQAAVAQKYTADAHTEAFKAAKLIVRDAAETLPEFSANQIRHLTDGIDSPVIGAAFTACAREGVIEATGRTVQSTDPATRHRIFIWSSLIHRGGAA